MLDGDATGSRSRPRPRVWRIVVRAAALPSGAPLGLPVPVLPVGLGEAF